MKPTPIQDELPSKDVDGKIPVDTPETLQQYLGELNANKNRWAQEIKPREILLFLREAHRNLLACADEWGELDRINRGRDPMRWDAVISYAAGPDTSIFILEQYIKTFEDLDKNQAPDYHKGFSTNEFGLTQVSIFPYNIKQKIIFSGIRGDLWFKPGYHQEKIQESQAHFYLKKSPPGKIAMVLGVGNYSAITISDMLHKLLNEREVVIIKMHPITKYIGPIIEKIFSAFIREGFLRIAYGGVEAGHFLSQHPLVDSIHLTGSDKTFENIVFEGDRKNPIQKRVSGELGCVSPVIIIPGPWSESDIQFQAENIVSAIAFNSGFNCNNARVLINQAGWDKRHDLLRAIESVLKEVESNTCYYPGAYEHMKWAANHYSNAKIIGEFENSKAPWIFAEGLDSKNTEEYAFKNEIWGPFTSETTISANSTIEYIEKAVEFCNQHLWGTLSAMIIVHPHSLRDHQVAAAFEKAIHDLNYGAVCVNVAPGFCWLLGCMAWGGAPGSTLQNIQSGNVWVHNPLMFEGIQKTVLRAPFRRFPKPFFPSNSKILKIGNRLHEFSKKPSWGNVIKIIFTSLL